MKANSESQEKGTMDTDDKLEEIRKELSILRIDYQKTYTAMFGVDGKGGIYDWLASVNTRVAQLTAYKNKMLGFIAAMSVISGFIGAKLAALIK